MPRPFNPMGLIGSGSQYEESSEDPNSIYSASCSPDQVMKGGKKMSNYYEGTTTNQSSHSSAIKGGFRMVTTENVDKEDQRNSDCESSGEEDPTSVDFEFNPKNFYWLFNPELLFSQR